MVTGSPQSARPSPSIPEHKPSRRLHVFSRLLLASYTTFLRLALPIYCWRMVRAGRWNREDVAQRYGRKVTGVPNGRIWIHAASMGEVRVGSSLAAELAVRGLAVSASATTETGHALIRQVFPPGTAAFLAPFDLPGPVARLIDAHQPRALVVVETEWWPNLILACHARAIPVFVVNGRISAKSYRWYRFTAHFWRDVLGGVAFFFMRSDEDAKRLLTLGTPQSQVSIAGSLKGMSIAVATPEVTAKWRSFVPMGARVWLAGSTRPGEEEMLLDAYQALRAEYADLRFVLVPRHPQRFKEVADLVTARSLSLSLWSAPSDGTPPNPHPDVVLVDVMGVLTELYALADAAFVGGSLKAFGGHNPLEPALAGTPVVFGPSMESQHDSAALLLRLKLAAQAVDTPELVSAIARALAVSGGADERARRSAELRRHLDDAPKRVAVELIEFLGRKREPVATVAH
jgi:3-deoxy-D-manno-octulosonic-acid transferase